MSGYAKLFSEILDSTSWRLPDPQRLLWIAMIAMANKQGDVRASIPGLADRARIPLDECIKGLEMFMSPEPMSRSQELEGRRIIEIDGGWNLINYVKYRDMLTAEKTREQTNQRVKAHRERKKQEKQLSLLAQTGAKKGAKGDGAKNSVTRRRREGEAQDLSDLDLANEHGGDNREAENSLKQTPGADEQCNVTCNAKTPDPATATEVVTAIHSSTGSPKERNIDIKEIPPPISPPLGGVSARVRDTKKQKTKNKYTKEFERLYACHPVNKDKKRAFEIWQKIKKNPETPPLDELLEIMERHKETQKWKAGYAPYLKTWLKNELWNDEIEEPPQKPNKQRANTVQSRNEAIYAELTGQDEQ